MLFDARFFELPERQRAESLSTFDWVEFRCDLKQSLPIPTIAAAGFVQVDVNLHFRIDLRTVAKTPSCEGLETNRASEKTPRVNSGELPAFANERFRFLPGVDIAKVNERYAVWGNQLVSKSPEWCFTVSQKGKVQGWFLSSMDAEGSLNLTLAMLSPKAEISGVHLCATNARTLCAWLCSNRSGYNFFSLPRKLPRTEYSQRQK